MFSSVRYEKKTLYYRNLVRTNDVTPSRKSILYEKATRKLDLMYATAIW